MTEIEIAQMAQLLRKMINPTLQMKLLKHGIHVMMIQSQELYIK
jgi:hypothetical protein